MRVEHLGLPKRQREVLRRLPASGTGVDVCTLFQQQLHHFQPVAQGGARPLPYPLRGSMERAGLLAHRASKKVLDKGEVLLGDLNERLIQTVAQQKPDF